MVVVIVVVISAAAAATSAATVAWKLPSFDPAAPRASARTVERRVDRHPRLARLLRSRLDPAAETGLALTVALVMVIGAGVAVGALFVMVQQDAGLARFDLTAARWGADHATESSTSTLRLVSVLGGTLAMVAIATATAVSEYLRTRAAAVFAFLLVVVGGNVIVMNLVKLLVDRERPDVARLTGYSGSSFPSGHAAAAAATFAAVGFLLGRGRPRAVKAALAAGAAGVAAAVATSRVLLGVHWLTDVVAGLALGWGWFALSSIAFGGRVLRFGRPVEIAEREAERAPPDPVRCEPAMPSGRNPT